MSPGILPPCGTLASPDCYKVPAVIFPHVTLGPGVAGWPGALQSLVWPWPAVREKIRMLHDQQCVFLLNLEQLSDTAFPTGHTVFSYGCYIRTQ
ncbi:hypothetical protein XENOCAPTIV_026189, partial [Xenoophorus captivus]